MNTSAITSGPSLVFHGEFPATPNLPARQVDLPITVKPEPMDGETWISKSTFASIGDAVAALKATGKARDHLFAATSARDGAIVLHNTRLASLPVDPSQGMWDGPLNLGALTGAPVTDTGDTYGAGWGWHTPSSGWVERADPSIVALVSAEGTVTFSPDPEIGVGVITPA